MMMIVDCLIWILWALLQAPRRTITAFHKNNHEALPFLHSSTEKPLQLYALHFCNNVFCGSTLCCASSFIYVDYADTSLYGWRFKILQTVRVRIIHRLCWTNHGSLTTDSTATTLLHKDTLPLKSRRIYCLTEWVICMKLSSAFGWKLGGPLFFRTLIK